MAQVSRVILGNVADEDFCVGILAKELGQVRTTLFSYLRRRPPI